MSIDIGNFKHVLAVNQASTTNGETTAGVIDTLGYDTVAVAVYLTTSNNVTNNPSVLKVGEGDTTSAFTNVSGFVGDTDFTIPACITAATSITGPFAVFNIDCRARKRYLQVSVTPVTTQLVTVAGILGRGEQVPVTAADVNASVVVNG